MDKFSEEKYDERQTAVRGRAFKFAYGTLLVALFFYIVTDGLWNWCVPLTGCACAIAVSLVPFTWVSIRNEAYWWADTNRKGQYIVFIFMGLFNLFLAADSLREGELIEDGVLQVAGANLVLGVLFVYVSILSLMQRARVRREDDDE